MSNAIARVLLPDGFDAYYSALGNFVAFFAELEARLQELLWKLANVSSPTAQAVFSGIRTDGAIQYIGRIAEAQKWDASKKAEWKNVSSQISDLSKLRNNLLHYGATYEGPDAWLVTNEPFVHIADRIHEYRVSPQILKDATRDLDKALLHLLFIGWADDVPPRVVIAAARTLNAAWRYKYPAPKGPKGQREGQPRSPKRSRRP